MHSGIWVETVVGQNSSNSEIQLSVHSSAWTLSLTIPNSSFSLHCASPQRLLHIHGNKCLIASSSVTLACKLVYLCSKLIDFLSDTYSSFMQMSFLDLLDALLRMTMSQRILLVHLVGDCYPISGSIDVP